MNNVLNVINNSIPVALFLASLFSYVVLRPIYNILNELKEAIVAEVAKFLAESGTNGYENVVISNKNRQISFKIGEKSFDFTLVEHRPPKK